MGTSEENGYVPEKYLREYNELLQYTKDEISRLYGIPKELFGIPTQSQINEWLLHKNMIFKINLILNKTK